MSAAATTTVVDRRLVADEIVSIGPMRIQKVFGLFNSVVAMEIYSPAFKRLYLIVDQNPHTPTLHVQKTRPVGTKTKSLMVNLLNKYVNDRTLRFYKIDEAGHVLKACFCTDDDAYALILEGPPKVAGALYKNEQLLASLRRNTTAPAHRKDAPSQKLHAPLGLLENEKAAAAYQARFERFYKKTLFDKRYSLAVHDLKKKQTLLKNVQNDYDKCKASLSLERDAELIKQNFRLLKRGQIAVSLMDYASGEPQKVIVNLDPSLGPKEYLDKVFNKIKRAKRGIATIEPRLLTIKNEVEQAARTIEELKCKGIDAIELNALALEQKPALSVKPHKRLPYRSYLSSDGISILVGRSARDSDSLTLHYCRGNEWWFHARDVAGAHVVVKSSLDNLPANTRIEAASLAINFSKAKSALHALVQYTRGKYVKKQKHLPPGMVLVAQEKTLDLTLDPDLVAAILKREN